MMAVTRVSTVYSLGRSTAIAGGFIFNLCCNVSPRLRNACQRLYTTQPTTKSHPIAALLYEVHAVKTAASYNLTRLDAILQRQSMFAKLPLVTEQQHSVRMLQLSNDNTTAVEYAHSKLFVFGNGTIVSWGQSENVLQALMTLMRPVETEGLSATVIAQEREVLQYKLTSKLSNLRNGLISLSTQIAVESDLPLDERRIERESLASYQMEDRKVVPLPVRMPVPLPPFVSAVAALGATSHVHIA